MDPRVADAVWKAIQGHLPPQPPDTHPLGCHRLRISDRDCFDGILARLVTGCSWDVAARLCKASETTLRARRTEWLTAGVFDKLVEEAIAGYDRIIGLDLSEVAVDGSLHKAPGGGEGTGPNPTDRAKIGWKWSVATDLLGAPIGWVIDGANRTAVLPDHPELARAAANQPPSHHRHDRQHQHRNRPERARRPGHRPVPHRHQLQRQRHRSVTSGPARLPRRLELHPAPKRHAVRIRSYFVAGPNCSRVATSLTRG